MNADGLDLFDLDIAARTVWGEARGEPQDGRLAVAHVLVNRWRVDDGATLEAICHKPSQFSCWNKDDPNEPRVRAASWDDPNLRACLRAVLEALDPHSQDLTGGARHYCAIGKTPDWIEGRQPTVTIGRHHFYAGIK